MLKRPPLNKAKIQKLLNNLIKCIAELEVRKKLTYDQFQIGYHFDLSSYFLFHALEDIFHVGLHILSRLPETELKGEYGEILPKLAKHKIIPQKYAQRNFKMSKYRNRLIHHYIEITKKEMYFILQEHLVDLEKFVIYTQKILKNPKKYGLELE